MNKQDLHVVSFSGGKDSTAMLLHMMELGMKIDLVLYCDTWMEFPAMYRHVEKIKKIVEDAGIKFVELRNPQSFKYLMLEHQPERRKSTQMKLKGNPQGYSWAGSRSRWCTSKLKTELLRAYKSKLEQEFNVIEYVGIAADEQYRLERERAINNINIPWLIGIGMKQLHCLIATQKDLIGKAYINCSTGFPVGAVHCNHWQN